MKYTSLVAAAVAGALLTGGAAAPALASAGPTATSTVVTAATAAPRVTSLSTHTVTVGTTRATFTVTGTLSGSLPKGAVVVLAYAPGGASEPDMVEATVHGTTATAHGYVDPADPAGSWDVSLAVFPSVDSEYPSSYKDGTLTVKRATSVSAKAPSSVTKGKTATVTGTVKKTVVAKGKASYQPYPGATVKVYADPKGKAPKKLVATVKASSKGTYSVKVKVASTTKVTVSYAGSGTYGASTKSLTVTAK